MRWVNRQLNRNHRIGLGAAPILMLVVLYLVLAGQRHADNPSDKILPLPDAMAKGLSALLFQPDQLSGNYLFWTDTLASLERLGLGLGIATLMTLAVGLVL
ncbi:MAG: ABC transporter permease, partial [Novosphingobium sp.]